MGPGRVGRHHPEERCTRGGNGRQTRDPRSGTGSAMTAERPARPLLDGQVRDPAGPRAARCRGRGWWTRCAPASTRLTVVVAPAGWGKTSLLSAWAADPGEHVRVAWVSLDEDDDEPTRFWTYVLTALQRRRRDRREPASTRSRRPGSNRSTSRCRCWSTSWPRRRRRTCLILDDYHTLADPRIHESVEFLVTYLPPSLRLVLAGRADPPLPLARLRARGELTELRAADLRFSADEAAALLSAVAGADVDATRRDRAVGADRGLGGGPAAGRAGAPGATRGRPHRPAPARLLHRRGAARPRPASARAARARRAARTPVGPALRRRAAGRPARPRCSPRWTAPTCSSSRWTPTAAWYRCHRLLREVLLARAVGRRRTRGPLPGGRLVRRARPARRRRRAPPARPGALARRRRIAARRPSRGSSNAGPPPASCMLGEQLPVRGRGRRSWRSRSPTPPPPAGDPDRVPHWLDRLPTAIGPRHRRPRVARPPRRGADAAGGHRHVRVGVRATRST